MAGRFGTLFSGKKKQSSTGAVPVSVFRFFHQLLDLFKKKSKQPKTFTINHETPSIQKATADSPTNRDALNQSANAAKKTQIQRVKTVGRGAQCQIVVAHGTVSGTHCEIQQLGNGSFVIRDLGSTNGTYVNGQKVYMQWTALQCGDALKLGGYECAFESPRGNLPVLKF